MKDATSPFVEQFYVVLAREQEDRSGPYTDWVIRKGRSGTTIRTFRKKQPAVSKANEIAVNQGAAGVVVSYRDGMGVERVIPNEDASVFSDVVSKATNPGDW
jgi:hypothetical protein